MAKIALYEIMSSREEEQRLKTEKANKLYSFTRKYNKMSNIQLFEEVLKKINVSTYLHISNNKQSWSKIYTDIHINIIKQEEKELYQFILRNIFLKSDSFVNSIENINSILNISFYYLFRLNDIETWEPKRNNPNFQLNNLIEHLFTKYKVPKFLYKGFYNYNTSSHKLIELLLHIGAGESIKKFTQIPKLKLNNRVYHHLFTTPEHLDMYQSFRRAQVLSMNGDKWLFDILMDSKLHSTATIEQDEFWVTVIQFFITNVMVSEKKIKEIIDFIDDQKFQRRYVNGVWENPPLPNFSMKGRTVDSLIRMSDNWHEIQAEATRLNRVAQNRNQLWRGNGAPNRYTPAPIKDFAWEKSLIKGYYLNKGKEVYDIIELINSRQLRDQSSSQRNCVYSYASQCAAGSCKIFTLRLNSEPLLTIQLNGYKLVQIKGKCNKTPSESEMLHVRKWVEKERLIIR